MWAYGAMPTLPVGIDEWHLARASVDKEIERIYRVDLGRELVQRLIVLDARARVIGRPQPDQLRAWQRRSRTVVAAAMLDDDAHAAFIPPTRAMG
jgi:hypothetical protein